MAQTELTKEFRKFFSVPESIFSVCELSSVKWFLHICYIAETITQTLASLQNSWSANLPSVPGNWPIKARVLCQPYDKYPYCKDTRCNNIEFLPSIHHKLVSRFNSSPNIKYLVLSNAGYRNHILCCSSCVNCFCLFHCLFFIRVLRITVLHGTWKTSRSMY